MEYENRAAERARRVINNAAKIAAELPYEQEDHKLHTITFNPRQRDRGFIVAFTSGEVVGSDQQDALVVPNRTLRILGQMGIAFQLT